MLVIVAEMVVQNFVDLEVQVSWQVQYFVRALKCRCRGRRSAIEP